MQVLLSAKKYLVVIPLYFWNNSMYDRKILEVLVLGLSNLNNFIDTAVFSFGFLTSYRNTQKKFTRKRIWQLTRIKNNVFNIHAHKNKYIK